MQNCYEVRNQCRIVMRLEINQIWQNCYEVRNLPNLAELL